VDADSWDAFFSSFRVEGRITYPAYAERELDRFEGELGFRLPHSYREFCRTFGPGEIGYPFHCNVAVPGPSEWHSYSEISFLGSELGTAYASDLRNAGISRPVLFGSDLSSYAYLWNAERVSSSVEYEFPVYVVRRLGDVTRLADTFFDFLSNTLLVDGVPGDDMTIPRERQFVPVACPFPSVHFPTEWRTSTVNSIASQMDSTRNFAAMPILADALQDAGCDNDDILNHCRGPGPHVRGCWVVDLILGKK
jgi:hypothetical protein